MTDRNALVNHIEDRLGSSGSRALAENVFDVLRADGRIYYTDEHNGQLALRTGVDLIVVAAELSAG